MNLLDHPLLFDWPEREAPSAWKEHIPFAFFVVSAMRPRVFVELGTHFGDSYCAFCQAVRRLNLTTRCYAVDTWRGDEHAGFYEADVLLDLKKHHDPRYETFSRLVQSSFDEALAHFPDRSIDLLHIDGLHTYESVRHDFEAWLPKLSDRAVVLFHDTNVKERDFGVYRLWDEVRIGRPHFEFLHGHGLGVLATGAMVSPELCSLFEARPDQVALIREVFSQLGRRLSSGYAQEDALRTLSRHLAAKDETIRDLTRRLDRITSTWVWRGLSRARRVLRASTRRSSPRSTP